MFLMFYAPKKTDSNVLFAGFKTVASINSTLWKNIILTHVPHGLGSRTNERKMEPDASLKERTFTQRATSGILLPTRRHFSSSSRSNNRGGSKSPPFFSQFAKNNGFQYVLQIFNSKNQRLRLITGESSGSQTTLTSWSDAWKMFANRKCPPEEPFVDEENINNTLLNCFHFLMLPRTYVDVLSEGVGSRVRMIIQFTEGVGCHFWWAKYPMHDDPGLSTFYIVDNYQLFFEQGYLREGKADFTHAELKHTEMLQSFKRICMDNKKLARQLGIDESLATVEEWPESMLDMAKFSIFFSNVVVRNVFKPEGIYNFSDSKKT